MPLTLTGYSTALFATWYFVDELGLLFDAGDGITSTLLHRSRKVKHVFVSHADRDHLTGLLQFNQLNAREGFPRIHYPRDCGSFKALAEFSTRFDPQVAGALWQPLAEGEEVRFGDVVVEPVRNGHVETAPEMMKSLSYRVWSVRRKLKPELAHLSGAEIKRLADEQGRDSTTTEVRVNLINYSGDTPVEDPTRWNGSDVLIHEATFLQDDQEDRVEAHGNKHSTLEEVMEMVASIRVGTLVLGHFSARYSAERIDRRIKELCDKYAVVLPVHRVLPGLASVDILRGTPINA